MTILSPSEGGVVLERSNVTLRYEGVREGWIQGYLTLDGEWAASLLAWASPSPNGTVISVPLHANATDVASGAHVLGARLFTSSHGPIDAATVGITLDRAPLVSASATYDHGLRQVRVLADVSDDATAPLAVRVSSGPAGLNASFTGAQELVLPVDLRPGAYVAQVSAVDARGQNTTVLAPYAVEDQPTSIEVLEATYILQDQLRVRARVQDADGVRNVNVSTTLGGGLLSRENATGDYVGVLRVDGRLGTHDASIAVWDRFDHLTKANFTFTIDGPREVLFERTIETNLGAYADATRLSFPRVQDGLIEFCIEGACGSSTWYVGVQVVAVIWEGNDLGIPTPQRTCGSPPVHDGCAFDILDRSEWFLDLAWAQTSPGSVPGRDVTVRVSGVRV